MYKVGWATLRTDLLEGYINRWVVLRPMSLAFYNHPSKSVVPFSISLSRIVFLKSLCPVRRYYCTRRASHAPPGIVFFAADNFNKPAFYVQLHNLKKVMVLYRVVVHHVVGVKAARDLCSLVCLTYFLLCDLLNSPQVHAVSFHVCKREFGIELLIRGKLQYFSLQVRDFLRLVVTMQSQKSLLTMIHDLRYTAGRAHGRANGEGEC